MQFSRIWNSGEGSVAENQLIPEIEQALSGLVKLMKALRFYPKGHPSLNGTVTDCMASLQALLNRQERRAIQVTQTGFSLGADKIGEKNLSLLELAHLLAERRVNQLIFLDDLPPQELLTFLEGLSLPAEEIYSIGGLPAFLRKHRVQSIWLNESSLDSAMLKRQLLIAEAEKAKATLNEGPLRLAEPLETVDISEQVRKVLAQLRKDQSNEGYQQQLDQLLKIAPVYFALNGLSGILRVLPLLWSQGQQTQRSLPQRTAAENTLERLLADAVINELLKQFKQTAIISPQKFQRMERFILDLGVRIAPHLLKQMTSEEDSGVRKRLSSVLGKMGAPLLDLLHEMLHSSKWFVVRNAVTLVGNLRLSSGLTLLEPLATHPDQRVRRAVINALAMIGGDKSVPPLLLLAQDEVVALRRPAVKALGATQSNKAVRPLLAIAQKFDFFGRYTDIRTDAVSALGILGQPEAITPLLALAKRPNPFGLQRLEDLRAEIILTLGKLADNKLQKAFDHWRTSPHAVVQRAADLSLANLARKNDNSAAN
jgi:HEAT repeat protein